MIRLAICALALLAVAVPPRFSVAQRTFVPAPPYYAVNPAAPPGLRAQSPLQQQILQNHRSQLLQTQRELFRQNPSGVTREQLEVRRQLNAFDPGFSAALPALPALPDSAPANAAPNP